MIDAQLDGARPGARRSTSPAASTAWSAWSRCSGRRSAGAPPDAAACSALALPRRGGPALRPGPLRASSTIPGQLGLACAPAAEPGAVEVAPVGGTFAALSRMTRPAARARGRRRAGLERPGALAARAGDARHLAARRRHGRPGRRPGQPVRRRARRATALESLKRALGGRRRAARSAPATSRRATGPGRWQMRCSYAADGLGPASCDLRLVAAGDAALGDHHARRQRAAAAPLRGDRQLVSALLIVAVVVAVLLGLHRRHGVAAAEPVQEVLVAAARRAERPEARARVGRPQIGQLGAVGGLGRSASPAMRPSSTTKLARRQRGVGHELGLAAEPLRRLAASARRRRPGSARSAGGSADAARPAPRAPRSAASTRSAVARGDGSRPPPPQQRAAAPGTGSPAAGRAAPG